MIENEEKIEEPVIDDDKEALGAENQPPEEVDSTAEEYTSAEDAPATEDSEVDYGEIAKEDLAELKRSFPELKDLRDITELKNPMRYAALRDLGLTAEEAYLATSRRASSYDNRAHLTPSIPGGASISREMSRGDYDMAREIFSELSDAEIRKLYRKVTK